MIENTSAEIPQKQVRMEHFTATEVYTSKVTNTEVMKKILYPYHS